MFLVLPDMNIVSSGRVKSYARWVEPLTKIGDCEAIKNYKTIEGTHTFIQLSSGRLSCTTVVANPFHILSS